MIIENLGILSGIVIINFVLICSIDTIMSFIISSRAEYLTLICLQVLVLFNYIIEEFYYKIIIIIYFDWSTNRVNNYKLSDQVTQPDGL